MIARCWIACGALLAAVAVAAGAYHAHGLESYFRSRNVDPVDAINRLHQFELAVRYHMLHAVALVLCGLVGLNRNTAWVVLASLAFLIGIAGFSGGLYAQALSGPVLPPHMVPIGGIAYMLGWLLLAIAAFWLRSGQAGH